MSFSPPSGGARGGQEIKYLKNFTAEIFFLTLMRIIFIEIMNPYDIILLKKYENAAAQLS